MRKYTIGIIVSTHGIKGEVKILSPLSETQKQEAFKVGSRVIVEDQIYTITRYRRHKQLDMLTFDGYDNINQVLPLLKKKVYKEKDELNLQDKDILDEELLEFKVKTEAGDMGIIKEIGLTGPNYKVLRLLINNREILIPYHKDFIIEINKDKKEITLRIP